MSQEEIEQIVQDFGIAAKKCKQAGADGVEIHAAHGYLISQFLSPYYNKRSDKYGGNVGNRAKLLLDILDSIRQNTDTAVMIANQVSTPIISVGGYRTIKGIESVLNSSDIAAISMSRPFICEPDLVKRWHSGDTSPAKCISCNGCFGDSFSCVL